MRKFASTLSLQSAIAAIAGVPSAVRLLPGQVKKAAPRILGVAAGAATLAIVTTTGAFAQGTTGGNTPVDPDVSGVTDITSFAQFTSQQVRGELWKIVPYAILVAIAIWGINWGRDQVFRKR